MGRKEQIIGERRRKLKALREEGVNPYPHHFIQKHHAADIIVKHTKLSANAKSSANVQIAGRVMRVRHLGKLAFATVQDGSGQIQIVLQKGTTDEKDFERFRKYIDAGDFVGISGTVMKTKTGEVSVLVKTVSILSKSLLPLPEKWHGLQDKEERYRKRYVDLIMDPSVKNAFLMRTQIMAAIRLFLEKKGFVEVETPYLQTLHGGAAARPFTTHLHTLDLELYLAISPELYLKRLIVGGYEKIFTLSRNFRNEGIDRWHNPEFTMLELYQAYADYNDMMSLFEELYESVCKDITGGTRVVFRGKTIDFKRPWKRMTMREALKKFAKIDVEKKSAKELRTIVKKENIMVKDEQNWGLLVQGLFEHYCEDKLEQPTFIVDHPLETTPLCKLHRDDPTCRLIERFEPFCMGAELGNAYTELNDPVVQRTLLEVQQKQLSKGDSEAHPLDEDFLHAMEIGMPPTGGLGLGVDRMVMLLTGQDSIRDVLLFPFMKPEGSIKKGGKDDRHHRKK